MEPLIVLLLVLLVLIGLPLTVLFQAWLLTVVARGAVGADISFGMALLTVVVAGAAQTCCSGALFGADGGLGGAVAGFLIYVGMLSLLNSLDFGRAVVIGVVMAVVQWAIVVALALLAVLTGLAALLGLGALIAL